MADANATTRQGGKPDSTRDQKKVAESIEGVDNATSGRGSQGAVAPPEGTSNTSLEDSENDPDNPSIDKINPYPSL
jgi:hypothetical protein